MTALEQHLSRRLARLRSLLTQLDNRPGRELEQAISEQIWETIDDLRQARSMLEALQRRDMPHNRVH
jgi:hypothetical protein